MSIAAGCRGRRDAHGREQLHLTFLRHLRNDPCLAAAGELSRGSAMPESSAREDRFSAARRSFLGRSGAALLALAPAAAWARATACRSLSFVHTHTGETLSCVYWQAGGYE